jgi:hypothetical protein
MSEVFAEGRHVQCQGHDTNGGCDRTDPAHDPKQAVADMRAAVRVLRTTPTKSRLGEQFAGDLADLIEEAAEDLAGALRQSKQWDGDPFEFVDAPGTLRRAIRFARSVNATTGDPS